MTRARQLRADRAGTSIAAAKDDAITFYENVIRGEYPVSAKLRAQENLDKIYALDKPSDDSASDKAAKVRALIAEANEQLNG